ncbi:hypothetical protein KR032_000160 [Drosophila birchii]|nr:hypothetical protein KR032_000160 [Drosophila birchii]
MQHRLAYLIVLLSTLNSACSLYFLMGETERRCFIQETLDDTTVTVNYKAEVRDPQHTKPLSPGIGMHWEVRDSDGRIVLSRTYNSEGRLYFTTHWPGEHYSLCLKSNSTAFFEGSQFRVHLDIRAGERTMDSGSVTQRMKLDQMQLKIRQLQNQAEEIYKDQNYQRFLEEQFRRTNDNIFSRMVWWTIIQVIVLVFLFAHMIHNVNKLSFLYKAFCKVLSENTLARVSSEGVR